MIKHWQVIILKQTDFRCALHALSSSCSPAAEVAGAGRLGGARCPGPGVAAIREQGPTRSRGPDPGPDPTTAASRCQSGAEALAVGAARTGTGPCAESAAKRPAHRDVPLAAALSMNGALPLAGACRSRRYLANVPFPKGPTDMHEHHDAAPQHNLP